MIGFVNRWLVLIFGYVYPAYQCYKNVEMNKPNPEHLRFWCQYWILAAFLMTCESVGDVFFGWIPLYSEVKLAFFVYLWYPKTKGSKYVYETFLRPFIAKHEKDIDRHLLELKTRAGDLVFFYWQRSAGYMHTRVFEIFRIIISQTPANQSAQPKQDSNNSQASAPASSTNPKAATGEESRMSEDLKAASSNEYRTPKAGKDPATPSAKGGENAFPTVRELIADEAGPLSQARLRRTNTPTR